MTAQEHRDSCFSALVLGTIVTILRHRHQISQIDLAKCLGLTQSTVSRLERGQMDPEAVFLEKLAQTFQLTPIRFAELRAESMAHTAQAVQATMAQTKGPGWWETALERVGYLGMAGLVVYVVSAVLEDLRPKPQRRKAKVSSASRAPRVHGRSARPGPRY